MQKRNVLGHPPNMQLPEIKKEKSNSLTQLHSQKRSKSLVLLWALQIKTDLSTPDFGLNPTTIKIYHESAIDLKRNWIGPLKNTFGLI